MPDSNLHKLSALGQSVWIDFLSRQMLQSGKLAEMMEEDAVVGVTSRTRRRSFSSSPRVTSRLRATS